MDTLHAVYGITAILLIFAAFVIGFVVGSLHERRAWKDFNEGLIDGIRAGTVAEPPDDNERS